METNAVLHFMAEGRESKISKLEGKSFPFSPSG